MLSHWWCADEGRAKTLDRRCLKPKTLELAEAFRARQVGAQIGDGASSRGLLTFWAFWIPAIAIFQCLKIVITIRLIGRLPLQFSIPLFVALIYIFLVHDPTCRLRICVYDYIAPGFRIRQKPPFISFLLLVRPHAIAVVCLPLPRTAPPTAAWL